MFISGPYMTSLLKKQAPELDGKWAVAPIPADETSTSLMAGSNLAIFHKSAQPEVAADFIDYLVQPEMQQAWFEAVNDLPARADALDALTGDPSIAVYSDQMQSAKPATDLANWGTVSQEMIRAVQQINLNDAPVGETIKQLNSTIGAK
jgi:ABC-type glycerol-3-phosphate transport system substrate-binding protein